MPSRPLSIIAGFPGIMMFPLWLALAHHTMRLVVLLTSVATSVSLRNLATVTAWCSRCVERHGMLNLAKVFLLRVVEIMEQNRTSLMNSVSSTT
jgi:hypothetical protein